MLKFETENLSMRQIEESDWDLFRSLETEQTVQLFVADIRSENEIRERFLSRLPIWCKDSNQWLCLVISSKETGEKIGITGFHSHWEKSGEAEVGFMLLPSFQGRGYGKESLLSIINFAFSECHFSKLNATVTEGNTASCKVLEKVGFQQKQVIPQNYKINGKLFDDIIYGLSSTEFKCPV